MDSFVLGRQYQVHGIVVCRMGCYEKINGSNFSFWRDVLARTTRRASMLRQSRRTVSWLPVLRVTVHWAVELIMNYKEKAANEYEVRRKSR